MNPSLILSLGKKINIELKCKVSTESQEIVNQIFDALTILKGQKIKRTRRNLSTILAQASKFADSKQALKFLSDLKAPKFALQAFEFKSDMTDAEFNKLLSKTLCDAMEPYLVAKFVFEVDVSNDLNKQKATKKLQYARDERHIIGVMDKNDPPAPANRHAKLIRVSEVYFLNLDKTRSDEIEAKKKEIIGLGASKKL